MGGPLPLWTSAVVLPTTGDLSVITGKGGTCGSALLLGQGLEWAGWERCGQEDARWGMEWEEESLPEGGREDREIGGVDSGTITGGKRGWGWGTVSWKDPGILA